MLILILGFVKGFSRNAHGKRRFIFLAKNPRAAQKSLSRPKILEPPKNPRADQISASRLKKSEYGRDSQKTRAIIWLF
jgi:hypothetical protein